MSADGTNFDFEAVLAGVASGEPKAVEASCRALVANVARLPAAQVSRALLQLRRGRHYGGMRRLADAAMQAGCADATIERLYAQALVDEGSSMLAERVLQGVEGVPELDEKERGEIRGLLGRVRKQRYVDAAASGRRSPALLEQSFRDYYGEYLARPEESLWHGVNAVALLARAKRDEVDLDGAPPPEQLAGEILARVKDRDLAGDATTYDLATAGEASLALRRTDEAKEWLQRYAEASGNDSFALASTWRQLRQVWQLDGKRGDGQQLLPVLEKKLFLTTDEERAEKVVSSVPILRPGSPLAALDRDGLERVFGTDGPRSYDWYKTGLVRAQAVGHVVRKGTSSPIGTGFLVVASDLRSDWGDELVFLTNAHVITDDPTIDLDAPRASEVTIKFEHLDAAYASVDVAEVKPVWHSVPLRAPASLDTAIARLAKPIPRGAVEPLPLFDDLAPLGDGMNHRVFLIGYPGTGPLSLSIDDNLLLDYDDQLLQYRTPAERGSSGSPAFDDEWRLVGLHHRGLDDLLRLHGSTETWPANEGIRIKAIRAALKT